MNTTDPYKSPLTNVMTIMRPALYVACVLSFFINLMILPVSLYSLQVLDRVISTGSMDTLLWLTFIMLIIFVAAAALQMFRSNMLLKVSGWMQEQLNEVVLPLSLAQAAQSPDAKGVQGLRDVFALRHFISGSSMVALLDAPWAVLYIIALYVVHPSLGMLAVGGAALLFMLALINEASMRTANKRAGELSMKNLRDLELTTRNAEVIEAMGMAPAVARRWHKAESIVRDYQYIAGERSFRLQGFIKFTRLTLQVLVTAISAYLTLKGEVTIGAIIAASILAGRAFAPFEASVTSWKAFLDVKNAYRRLKELLDMPARPQTIELPEPKGALSIEELSYIAPGQNTHILKNISFKLEPGEIIGLIGPSGSGKSTLARLISGTWKASEGCVRLDGADVYSWPRESFGKFLGYMPQGVELFAGSVRDNISRLQDDATDEKIIQAAEMAGAHQLILQLPQGYDTEIGPGGAALSGGQRQRIALARALYGRPKLLLLDEPDANLDDAGQKALNEALHVAKARGITTVLISHRRGILNQADKILYLKDGMVQAFGPRRTIMAEISAAMHNGAQ